jgi:hypothetical protein
MDCKHQTVKVETITHNAGMTTQKCFSFVRCTSCGTIFPVSPDPDNSIERQLMAINSKLELISTNIAGIKRGIETKK